MNLTTSESLDVVIYWVQCVKQNWYVLRCQSRRKVLKFQQKSDISMHFMFYHKLSPKMTNLSWQKREMSRCNASRRVHSLEINIQPWCKLEKVNNMSSWTPSSAPRFFFWGRSEKKSGKKSTRSREWMSEKKKKVGMVRKLEELRTCWCFFFLSRLPCGPMKTVRD